jgi:hypothetical protein
MSCGLILTGSQLEVSKNPTMDMNQDRHGIMPVSIANWEYTQSDHHHPTGVDSESGAFRFVRVC